jgi:hypothetical protein
MRHADAAARAIRDLWTASARSGSKLRTVWRAPKAIASRTPESLRHALAKPVDALPLDVFRILVGSLSLAYFLRTLLESRLYSSADGLIDHELIMAIFPVTRMGMFQPGMPLVVLQAFYVVACIGSLAIIAGYRVRLVAAVLYVIAVSTYRWNFLVMYVDDVIMHLMFFWLILLPVGRTLVLTEWLSRRGQAWRRWKTTTVPGTAVRCFLWNVALIYIVAGLWKWTSPMWRNGTALYAVLKLPIAYTPDFWGPQHMPLLKTLTFISLFLETIFPIVFFLPKGHRARYALLVAFLGFHLGMIVTLKIPFANFACIGAMVVVFGAELMFWLGRRPRVVEEKPGTAPIGWQGVVAIVMVATLTMAMLTSITIPHWRSPVRGKPAVADDAARDGLTPLQMVFFVPLWIAGLAQQYQLFNWIDDRNYSIHYDVMRTDGAGVRTADPNGVFLTTTRSNLLQAYVYGVSWMQIPTRQREQLRTSIYLRSARRYCRGVEGTTDVSVSSNLRRINSADLNGGEQSHALLMQFRCSNGEALMQKMNLNP